MGTWEGMNVLSKINEYQFFLLFSTNIVIFHGQYTQKLIKYYMNAIYTLDYRHIIYKLSY